MKHAKERPTIQSFFYNLYISYIPNRRDNKKQVILKLFFLIALIVFIGSAVYLTNYFLTAKKQDSIIDESRKLWHSSSSQSAGTAAPSTSITDLMLAENSDFPFSVGSRGERAGQCIYLIRKLFDEAWEMYGNTGSPSRLIIAVKL